jgi:NAD(P)-dependent dehydrogenase (short-subunit alcohol dehydrogenase family)
VQSQNQAIFDLSGRVALVTGGAGLLGAEFVRSLAAAGARVYSIDVNSGRLDAVRAGYAKDIAERVNPCELDITNEAAVDHVVDRIHANEGHIDILVNSAAVDPKFDAHALARGESPGAFTSYSLANWQRSMDVNLTGAFLITRAVCRHMESANRGVIINISSTYGLVGPDQRIYENDNDTNRFFKPVDYSVTKAGILGFTRALAAYYQNRGIRVNALSPVGTYNGNP